MSDRIYVCIHINTDHSVRDVEKAFESRTAAEGYCACKNYIDELEQSDATEQTDDYLYTNGVDNFGYVIETTKLETGESR